MNTTIMICILVGYLAYFGITFIWFYKTLNYEYTLNHYAFKFELKKPQRSIMFYLEVAMVILLLIGFITTLYSQIQIIVRKIKK